MLKISAQVKNSQNSHSVVLNTNNNEHALTISPRTTGYGSRANGGELLFLALATCYCNDMYREAAKRSITVRSVQVEVTGEFGDVPGSAAENIAYEAVVEAEASEEEILDLMTYTDTVAEVQNTLRQGIPVTLTSVKAIPV